MPKILIHYFSGTGNSLLAAKILVKELEGYGYVPVFQNIEDRIYGNSNDFDIHIFFFPIYATAIPHIVAKYIHSIPDGKKAKTAIISANGRISTRFRDGYQGWALHQARFYLLLRNYDVFFSDTLDFPHNVTIGIPPRNRKYNQQIISQASAKIPKIAENIARRKKSHRNILLFNFIWSIPFGILYSFIGRRFIGKLFASDSKCNSCGFCARKCPARTVRMVDKKPNWNWNCEGCLRCINNCPKQAIQVSLVRLLVLVWLSVASPLFLLNRLIPAEFYNNMGNAGSIILNITIYIVPTLLFFIILDYSIFRLSFLPILGKIMSWGYTKAYGRYSADKYGDEFLKR